jgi:DNA-binding transcriptional regulator YhcF (GntR family)
MQRLARPRRVLLAEQVAQSIEQEIDAGRWRQWLPSERTLQRVLNVSRQTVRAALQRLQASRRIAVLPYRGYRIAATKRKRVQGPPSREVAVICSEPVYRMPPRFIQVLDVFRTLCAEAGVNVDVMDGERFKRTDPGRLMPRLVRSNRRRAWVLVLADRRCRNGLSVAANPRGVW